MIKEKDVIRMKVPFPNIDSQLAAKAHMYICKQDSSPNYGFVKVQTLKPQMINSRILLHYVDEQADLSRNPFSHASRIDCDKLFVSSSVEYSDALKTSSRPDICQPLYDKISEELIADGYSNIAMNEDDLVELNELIEKI